MELISDEKILNKNDLGGAFKNSQSLEIFMYMKPYHPQHQKLPSSLQAQHPETILHSHAPKILHLALLLLLTGIQCSESGKTLLKMLTGKTECHADAIRPKSKSFRQELSHSGLSSTFSTGNRTSSPFSNTPNFDSRIPWSSNHLLAAVTFHAHTWHCVIMHPHLPEDPTKTHEVPLIHWFRCPGHPSSYLNQRHSFKTTVNLTPNCNMYIDIQRQMNMVHCIILLKLQSMQKLLCQRKQFPHMSKYLAKSSSIVHRIYVYTVIIGPSQHCL